RARKNAGYIYIIVRVKDDAFSALELRPANALRPHEIAAAVELGDEDVILPGAGQVERARAGVEIHGQQVFAGDVNILIRVDGDGGDFLVIGSADAFCPHEITAAVQF